MSLLLPRRRCREQLTWQPHQFGYRTGADAVVDLLQQRRTAEFPRYVTQPGKRAGEVSVTVVLYCLLQRIRMHRKVIRSNPVERLGDVGDGGLAQL